MYRTIKRCRFFFALLLFSFFCSLFFLPTLSLQASPHVVRIDGGSSLESALANEESLILDEITRLNISGNGNLSPEDGLFLRENLPSVNTLDLREFTGTSDTGAFRGCTTLTTLLLPEHFVVSPEMFYGCSLLDDLVLPVRYQLSKDSFSYCALDFSQEYPSLLDDENVLTFAAHQRPKVYFSFPDGNRGTLSQGETFPTPYQLLTRDGSSYLTLVQQAPDWLLMRPEDLAMTTTIYFNGELVNDVDTNQVGEYEIIYTLPYSTYANTNSQTYYLTVSAESMELEPLLDEAMALDDSHYTEESWQALDILLEGFGEDTIKTLSESEQNNLANDLSNAMAQLEIRLLGVPDTNIQVGQVVRLQPANGLSVGLDNWTWDEEYLSADAEQGGAIFTSKQAGTTEIIYTAPTGEQGLLTLEISDEGYVAGAPAENEAGSQSTSPTWLWITVLSLYAFIVLSLLIIWYYQKRFLSK